MDKSENRKAVTVGIFVAIGILIFLIGVFTLGGQQKSFEKVIRLKAVFTDVNGLKKGDNIWFSGVKVGVINTLSFTTDSKVEVRMNVESKVSQFIHQNSEAKISSDGLIGNKIIVIDGGNPSMPAVKDGDQLAVSAQLSTDDMMKTLQKNNENLLAITSNFKTVSSKMTHGQGTVGELMSDSSMAKQFRTIVKNLEVTTHTTARMAGQMESFATRMNDKKGLMNRMLTDTVIFSQLRNSVSELKKTASSATKLTSNLNQASEKLNRDDNVIGLLLNNRKAAAQVQTTLTQLQASSAKLNIDLEAAQHNFLLRGYFKKQEKAKKMSKDSANNR